MESETTIFEEPTLIQRLTQKRILGKLSVLSVTLLVLGAIVAAATSGILLGRITAPQTSSRFTVTLAPSPMPAAGLGLTFPFNVTVGNPSTQTALVTLGLVASCPVNGNATVSGGAAGDACAVGGLQTSSVSIASGGSHKFFFNVTYTGNDGPYYWTFTAYTA